MQFREGLSAHFQGYLRHAPTVELAHHAVRAAAEHHGALLGRDQQAHSADLSGRDLLIAHHAVRPHIEQSDVSIRAAAVQSRARRQILQAVHAHASPQRSAVDHHLVRRQVPEGERSVASQRGGAVARHQRRKRHRDDGQDAGERRFEERRVGRGVHHAQSALLRAVDDQIAIGLGGGIAPIQTEDLVSAGERGVERAFVRVSIEVVDTEHALAASRSELLSVPRPLAAVDSLGEHAHFHLIRDRQRLHGRFLLGGHDLRGGLARERGVEIDGVGGLH